MRTWQTKTDNTAPAPSGILTAAEDNARAVEANNLVTTAGITLNSISGPDTNLKMMAEAVARYASGGVYYSDSGAANAYVLSTPSGVSGFVMPKAYFQGMHIVFIPGHDNTGASTVNVNAIGSKKLMSAAGAALATGTVVTNRLIEAYYNSAADGGAGAFCLAPWATTSAAGPGGAQLIMPPTLQILTSSGSYSKPTNLVAIFMRMVGGGASGGSRGDNYYGGSGSTGAYIEEWIAAESLPSSISYTIGAGGSPVSANTWADGNNGSSTTFHGRTAGAGLGGLQNTGSQAGGSYSGVGSKGFGLAGNSGQYGLSTAIHQVGILGGFGMGGRGGNTTYPSVIGGQGVIIINEYLAA